MATWIGVVTNVGKALFATWVDGTTLNFDAAEGGTGTVPEASLLVQTALANKKQDISIIGSERTADGVKLTVQITAPATGYTLNQIGIKGSVDSGALALAALFQTPDGVTIPSVAQTPDFIYKFFGTIQVSNTGTFTVTIDTSAVVAQSTLDAAIEAHNNDPRAHENIWVAVEEAATTANAALSDAAEATTAAHAAQDTADEALSAAGQAQSSADNAASAAAAAQSTADDALSAAGSAKSAADSAQVAADNAQSTADAAASAAAGAQVTADEAKELGAEAKAAAETAQETADAALDAISDLTHTIDAVPTQSGTLSYTGSVQSPSWNSYNPAMLTLSGVTTGTNAGTYTTVFTPVEGYKWTDGTTTAKSVTWTIGRATIASIPTQSGILTYSGSAQSPAWSGYNSDQLTIGGTSSATAAGSYNATFTPTSNYRWSDGTTEAKSVAWSITRATISATPSQSGTLTYTGSAQTPSWSNYSSTQLTLGGTSSGTNAGSYTATFTPTSNYRWSDGTTTAKSVAWTIGKAVGSLSINKTSLSLSDTAATGTVTVTRSGDGAITATSSSTTVATVSVSGTTVTVTGKANGTATITINVAAGTNHTAPTSKTVSVTVAFANVFGVIWNYANTSTALTRLTKTSDPNGLVTVNITTSPAPAVGTGSGSSPFDGYAPWSGMEEYNIISNAVSYKKGQTGFSRTSNDTAVFIPAFYFRIVDDATNSKRYFYIADKAKTGFTLHPGSGRYVGKYNTATGHVTKSGLAPLVSTSRTTFRTSARSKGTKWFQYDVATWNAIQLLYLVEFADWNSQTKIGRGIVDNSSRQNSGLTDTMTYHTGRAAGTDGQTAVQYRCIENPWGNVYDWLDGLNEYGTTFYVCTTPANYADDTSTNYTNAGWALPGSGGYITKLGYNSSLSWLMFQSAIGGSDSTYLADYGHSASSAAWYAPYVGGSYSNASGAGLFMASYNSASSASASIGGRLLFVP